MMLIQIGILLVSVSVSSSSASVHSADLLQLDDGQNIPDGILSLLQLGQPDKHRTEFQVGALTHKLPNAEPKNRYQKKNKKKLSNKGVLDAIENIVQQLKSKFGDTFKVKNRNIKDRPVTSKDSFSNDLVKAAGASRPFENTINNVLQNMMKPSKKSRPGKLVQPSNLLQGNNVNLDKYSKIFIILNPQALSVKPAGFSRQATMPRIRKKRYYYHTKGTTPQHQEHIQYGGDQEAEADHDVVIYADWRRRMDDEGSSEGPKGKRPRSGDYRTAIPFIGHKGDIYERDE